MSLNKKIEQRQRRRLRYKARNRGTAERPRLAIFRSNAQLYAQIIDDAQGRTLVQVTTLQKGVADGLKSHKSVEAAKRVGVALGKAALAAGVQQVVFDKGGFVYTGRLKALADAAREQGLKF